MIKYLFVNIGLYFVGCLAFLFFAFASGFASNFNAHKTSLIITYLLMGFVHLLLCWIFLRKKLTGEVFWYLIVIVALLYFGAFSFFF